MGWFGKSTSDKLMDLLAAERQERRASEARLFAMAEKLIDASTEHAKLGEKYLSLFTGTQAESRVRLMTDADEVAHEQARRAESVVMPQSLGFDPQEWFADMKKDIFA